MKARQVFYYKANQDGLIVEMIVWQLPYFSEERSHGYKYRFFCGSDDGECLVRYDNEAGKGDHRHYDDSEESYSFESLQKLITDFKNDCAKAGWKWT